MAIDPEALYLELGQLVAAMPADLLGSEPVSAETRRWVARVGVLIESMPFATDANLISDRIAFNMAAEHLHGITREGNAQKIITIAHRALARAERNAPVAARGAFIAVGAAFEAVQAIGKVLREAKKDVFIVDAFMDGTLISDFAPLTPERVPLRLLSDGSTAKLASLRPLVERWVKQYAADRPLEVKLSPPRALHDRLIVIDGGDRVWSLTQSFNHLVARSPASLLRVDDKEIAVPKRDYYFQVWNTAAPL